MPFWVAAVSWLDDVRTLPNWIRLSVHLAAAAIAVIGIGPWRDLQLPWLGSLHLGWLAVPVTVLWIVGLTNAYNFMDGIDGIAGAQAVIAGLGWALLGWLTGQMMVATLGILIAATSLGFLGHNWPPARIFMGDVGSAFLGYMFAVLAVLAGRSNPPLGFAGVLLVWPFVFDAVLTFLACRRCMPRWRCWAYSAGCAVYPGRTSRGHGRRSADPVRRAEFVGGSGGVRATFGKPATR